MTDEERMDIEKRFEEEGSIIIIWNIEDVQEIDPDISDELALEVLKTARDRHNANIGINWGVLEDIMISM